MTAGIQGYHRPEDDTFLTYPEWYIVWSYDEKANYQREHLPGRFPYFGSIGQYWSGYCCVYSAVRDAYPFNFGDHLMLAVIGTSFTVEYALKGAYEHTVGRLSEWTSGGELVDEDAYAYHVAKEYADFVHIRPFYEFHFLRSFLGLWSGTRLWGTHPIRKWERKLWLSLDYGAETVYCGVIELGSHAVYGVESIDTYAWIENAPKTVFAENPHVRKVKEAAPESFIVTIPRYQEFTDVAIKLARSGVRFVEIAGNNQVFVTAIGSRESRSELQGGELLFRRPILTDPGSDRMAIVAPVSNLSFLLNSLSDRGYRVEHVYDY